MLRSVCAALLLASSVSTAYAQAKAAQPGQFTAPSPGAYSGSIKDANGAATSDVKLNIKDVTKDGRVTARVTASKSPNPACVNKELPASGIMLNDNSMRLEVDAGAPEGCERVYNVSANGGSLTGTYTEAKPRAMKK